MPYSKTKYSVEERRAMRRAVCNRYNAKHRHLVRERRRKYYEQNPDKFHQWNTTEKRRVYMRKFRADNAQALKLYRKAYGILRTFGITLEQRDAIFAKSGGLCAICNDRQATHLDHCHKTGKLRGGLCHRCNSGIGMLNDDPKLALSAYEYLERNK